MSLFSGIGGIDLAAHWAGMTTIAFVEQNKFCQKVLAKHWPNVPIFDDVKTFTKDDISEPVDIISGGFPCQPFSVAGNQLGREDDRHLWPEYLRIIEEFKPTWVVGENVAGIIAMELDNVLSDLELCGYQTRTFAIQACTVGARHRRERIFIIGFNAECSNANRKRNGEKPGSDFEFRQETQNIKKRNSRKYELGAEHDGERFDTYAGALRKLYGIPNWMDRLKSLGNAVMPEQIYPILANIYDIEKATPQRQALSPNEQEEVLDVS